MHGSPARSAFALALTLLAARAEAVVEVTACGQVIPRGETGVLVSDLTCISQYGVRLETNATLDLGNHTLSHFAIEIPSWEFSAAVFCGSTNPVTSASSCRVVGEPGGTGAIVGDGGQRFGIAGRKVEVENMSISGFLLAAIDAKVATVTDVVASDNTNCAVCAQRKVRATRVAAETNGVGIRAYGRVIGADLSLVGNNYVGVTAGDLVKVSGLTASANEVGVSATAVRLSASTLAGNGIDITARNRPRIASGSCETSRKLGPGPEPLAETWGVCAAD